MEYVFVLLQTVCIIWIEIKEVFSFHNLMFLNLILLLYSKGYPKKLLFRLNEMQFSVNYCISSWVLPLQYVDKIFWNSIGYFLEEQNSLLSGNKWEWKRIQINSYFIFIHYKSSVEHQMIPNTVKRGVRIRKTRLSSSFISLYYNIRNLE